MTKDILPLTRCLVCGQEMINDDIFKDTHIMVSHKKLYDLYIKKGITEGDKALFKEAKKGRYIKHV